MATIQDIKDVAIFTTKRENLFPEFITYFHTVSVDKFLRSMLVYFQYYLQVISALFKAISSDLMRSNKTRRYPSKRSGIKCN